MSNSNLQSGIPQKKTFSAVVASSKMQTAIMNTLQDAARSKRFTASIISAVSANKQLQECNSGSIISSALLGESLNLSPSPQLGQYYLLPFDLTAKGPDGKPLRDETGKVVKEKHAQFVLGYKGYIQLAIRSGYYADIGVMEVKEGEYKGKDSKTGNPLFNFIDDDTRDDLPVIGYMAYFEYLNGFKKVLYWSKEKMLKHADEYSNAFSAAEYKRLQNGEIPEEQKWKYSSYWYKSFDDMACKTMLRQLISKWGIMSIEMQNAIESDGTTNEIRDGNVTHVETTGITVKDTVAETQTVETVEQVDLNDL